MTATKASLLVRAWKGFWRCISFIRAGLANFVFIIILIIFISAIIGEGNKPLPASAPLVIAPNGPLVDQTDYTDPLALFVSGKNNRDSQTNLRELIQVIDAAAADSRISALILQLDRLSDSGMSKSAEFGEAIIRFKTSKKPVIAYADHFSQQRYFLAAHADEIYLNDLGGVMLTGIGLYRNYFKTALDKLTVKFHIFKVGTFKDFVEPFTRDDMSEASKQHNSEWVHELWGLYTNRIESLRHLDAGSINTLLNNASDALTAAGNDTAKLALNAKLVDHVGSRVERMQALITRFGADPDHPTVFQHVNYTQYKRDLDSKSPSLAAGNIGLIVASGEIVDGDVPEGQIGGDSMAALLRKAREDKDISALIIRVDSGGGSAFASEIIRQEIQALRRTGKKVYISMGSVAASGGYWIASGADEIWATPFTITGSIGVFGLFPSLHEGLNKLGIYSDGVATHNISGGMRMDRPLDPTVAKVAQQSVDSIYQRFLGLVAEARKRSIPEIDAIAQGRVWTGSRAQALGLVDHLGYFNDLVAAVARNHTIEKPQIKLIERDLTPQEKLIRNLMEKTSANFAASAVSQWYTGANKLLESSPLASQLIADGKNELIIKATCYDCIAP